MLLKRKGFYVLTLGTALSAIMVGGDAMAQGDPSADPGRVQQELQREFQPPAAQPKITIEPRDVDRPPANAEDVEFNLSMLQIEGATVYTQDEMRSVYDQYLGKDITLATLYQIAAQLTRKYRNDGYILTQVIVPPQTIDAGTARLRVVEGYIDNVIIEGETGSSLNLIRKYAAHFKDMAPVNVDYMERYLLLIRDLPGVDARSVLSPSADKTGAADLRIIIERDTYQAQLGANNHGNKFLGREQFAASQVLNSVLGLNERIAQQVVVAPDAGNIELAYIYGEYLQPIGSFGTTAEVQVSYTDTDPGFTLAPLSVEGRSFYTSFKVEHPIFRTRERNLYGHIMLDFRNVDTESIAFDTVEDDIRMLRVGGRYESVDTIFGAGVNTFDVEVATGLEILGASEEGDADLTRGNANPQATKIEAGFSRLQRVTDNLNLFVRTEGQWATSSMLSSEEFGVGGVNLGRGYDSSEIIGDDGVAGSVELQWNSPYNIDYVDEYQLYAFYDAGRVWNDNPGSDSLERDTLTSTGLGLRLGVLDNTLQFNGFVGVPLNRSVETEGDEDPRFFVSLTKTF